MKTTLSLILAAASTGLVLAQANPQPEPASADRQPLERWLGDWTFERTGRDTPLGAAGISLGAYSVLPIPDTRPGEPRGRATVPEANLQWIDADGFDPERGCFFWDSFAGDGPVVDATYAFDGPRVTMVGTLLAKGKRYTLRSTVTFADDFQSLTDRREISTDGVHWTQLSESRATKVMTALAAPDSDQPKAAATDHPCAPENPPPQ